MTAKSPPTHASKPPQNYILIGMAGVGKTTLGKHFAEAIGYTFVDTDHLIEAYHGRALQSILNDFKAEDNLDGFLAEERRIFRASGPFTQTVISTGGSFCYSPELVRLHSALVIYLHISWDALSRRLGSFDGRGFVLREATLEKEFERREPLYASQSHCTISCDGKSITTLTEELQALHHEGRVVPRK